TELIQRWRRLQPTLYGHAGPNQPKNQPPLIYPSGIESLDAWDGRAKSTPTSMRNVDASCEASVIQQF
ncbi:MAG TPA: hypothetical protein VIK28_00710, partial [Sedimentisphaerales bacterium]